MKMSAFPNLAGFPSLASAQLLLSGAGGGLNLPNPPNVSSPKELPNVSPTSVSGLPGVPRVPNLPNDLSIGGGHHPPSGYLPSHLGPNIPPGMIDPRLFYPALNGGYDLKDNTDALLAWRQFAAQAQQAANAGVVLSYDAQAAMAAASFSYPSYPSIDLNGARRKNATRETTSTLKAWLYEHRKNPYPTKGEKIMLAIITKMTLTQVSTWFANARRRLKKENKMTWSPRNRTDDGSSMDGEDKPDNEDGVVGDDDDDISIDLSDFETESNSPQKPSTTAASSIAPNTVQAGSTMAATQSPVSSPEEQTGSSKPRIWSIADVAANKPSPPAKHTPLHHKSTSVRHRPYAMPNSTAFRPWFDNSYRQLVGAPGAASVLGNPSLSASRPTTTPSLRVPHLSVSSTSSPISHSVISPSSTSPSSDNTAVDRTIKSDSTATPRRVSHHERSSSPSHLTISKQDQEH